MKTAIKQQSLGVLYYGNKPIGKPDTFRNLGSKARQLIAEGYNPSLIHKHYYCHDNKNNTVYNSYSSCSSSNTQHTRNEETRKEYISETSTIEMSLEKHILRDFWDSTWLNKYMSEMGEDAFWRYQAKVYILLNKLEVGQSIEIQKWVKAETIDLFVKIACCFVQEKKGDYQFRKDYTIITHKYDDAREMEITHRLLRQKCREKETGGDGDGAGSGIPGTVSISTSQPTI